MNTKTEDSSRPTVRDMVLLDVPSEVKTAADGSKVAIQVRTTNWHENQYENRCYVYDHTAGTTRPLTREGDVQQMAWVGADTLALLKESDDEEAQIWLYEELIGEGWPVTDHDKGVQWFEPFAGGFLFLAPDPERAEKKKRAAKYGKYTHFEQERSSTALYYVDLQRLQTYRERVRASTEEEAKDLVKPIIEVSRLLQEPLHIESVRPSPRGDALYLNCWEGEDLVYWRQTSAFYIRFDPAAAVDEYVRRQKEKAADDAATEDDAAQDFSYLGELKRLNLPRAASVAEISPDGQQLLISHRERDDKMYTREDLWLIEADEALNAATPEQFLQKMANITGALDRQVIERHWVKSGIYGAYIDGTQTRIARFAGDGTFTTIDLEERVPRGGFHPGDEGTITFIGGRIFPEAYLAGAPREDGSRSVQPLTSFGRTVEAWNLGTAETVRWPSKDGTEIEGVLRKPANFDPERRYPLVFVVHGGPEWFSEEAVIAWEELGYYPNLQFVQKDVLVLRPNYRGSLGRGQAFSDLNVGNLGTGDLWDLESAIDYLSGLGIVDEERIGCMGWSQGGYISAFAALHSDRFKAVSVGAGVSDWYTYHISNDIPDFTLDYLASSPFRDRAPYEKSAPISNLANAHTPMLIQHGSEDRRVPPSNAMELYRAMKEMDVPVELFIFPGMSHPISKPRENHAVMSQNLAWFSHYLLGEELHLE